MRPRKDRFTDIPLEQYEQTGDRMLRPASAETPAPAANSAVDRPLALSSIYDQPRPATGRSSEWSGGVRGRVLSGEPLGGDSQQVLLAAFAILAESVSGPRAGGASNANQNQVIDSRDIASRAASAANTSAATGAEGGGAPEKKKDQRRRNRVMGAVVVTALLSGGAYAIAGKTDLNPLNRVSGVNQQLDLTELRARQEALATGEISALDDYPIGVSSFQVSAEAMWDATDDGQPNHQGIDEVLIDNALVTVDMQNVQWVIDVPVGDPETTAVTEVAESTESATGSTVIDLGRVSLAAVVTPDFLGAAVDAPVFSNVSEAETAQMLGVSTVEARSLRDLYDTHRDDLMYQVAAEGINQVVVSAANVEIVTSVKGALTSAFGLEPGEVTFKNDVEFPSNVPGQTYIDGIVDHDSSVFRPVIDQFSAPQVANVTFESVGGE